MRANAAARVPGAFAGRLRPAGQSYVPGQWLATDIAGIASGNPTQAALGAAEFGAIHPQFVPGATSAPATPPATTSAPSTIPEQTGPSSDWGGGVTMTDAGFTDGGTPSAPSTPSGPSSEYLPAVGWPTSAPAAPQGRNTGLLVVAGLAAIGIGAVVYFAMRK